MTVTSGELMNWGRSHRYRATELHRPRTVEGLRGLLRDTRGTVQVLATRHTFTAIGDADALIAVDELEGADRIEIDPSAMTVTVGPAVTYASLADELSAHGLALHNLASLPHISVIGAIATATHGSGDALGNLATAVCGLEILTSDGDLVRIADDDPRLPGAAVHLGALGVVLAATLRVQPYYELRQDVYLGLGWDVLAEHFDEVMGAGRSVSVFHEFGASTREVWVKGNPEAPVGADLFGARAARDPHNPVPGELPDNCTAQLGLAGAWSERLPHFRAGFTPSVGAEIQSEYFVAREDAMAAIDALRGIADVITPVLRIAELRTIAGDALWMSPQHDRETAGLHFTWALEPDAVIAVCAQVEAALQPLRPRIHWGKMHAGRPRLPARAQDWLALRGQLDPRGVFRNAWLRDEGL